MTTGSCLKDFPEADSSHSIQRAGGHICGGGCAFWKICHASKQILEIVIQLNSPGALRGVNSESTRVQRVLEYHTLRFKNNV